MDMGHNHCESEGDERVEAHRSSDLELQLRPLGVYILFRRSHLDNEYTSNVEVEVLILRRRTAAPLIVTMVHMVLRRDREAILSGFLN